MSGDDDFRGRLTIDMGSLSPVHWLIVLAVVLLLFGPAGLAGIGKGLGEGLRSFKKGMSDEPPADAKDDENAAVSQKPTPSASDRA